MKILTLRAGGRMGIDAEKGQSIFLACREEQGQRTQKKASKLIFDPNLKAKPHCAENDHPFFYLTLRLGSSGVAKGY